MTHNQSYYIKNTSASDSFLVKCVYNVILAMFVGKIPYTIRIFYYSGYHEKANGHINQKN